MSSGILNLIVVFALIMLNALFAMSEFAVISSRKLRLQQLAEEGDRRAGVALDLARNPQRFLATIQIGITLIGVLSGAFGEAALSKNLEEVIVSSTSLPFLIEHSGKISLALVVGLITYCSLIAELVPKRLALNSPERLAAAVAKPMKLLSRIAAPAIKLLSISTEFVLRIGRVRPSKEPPVTEDEIRLLIDQATLAGVFEEVEQEMVERVFRLGDRRVGAMMTPRNKIEWLDVAESADKTRRRIARSVFSRFPVGHARLGNILGVVHVRDLAVRCLNGQPLDLRASMLKPLFVHENTHALKVLELFRQSGMQMAIVVDEYGTIEGMVTLTDILEAIVGDIPSSREEEGQRIVEREDGSWLVDGMLAVDELKAHLEIKKLPEERTGRFHTLGGFIMAYLKRVPSTGDHFECCGYRFEVVDMDGHRVDKVLVNRLKPAPPAEDEAGQEAGKE